MIVAKRGSQAQQTWYKNLEPSYIIGFNNLCVKLALALVYQLRETLKSYWTLHEIFNRGIRPIQIA
jgi:hypothetical protein